MFFGTVAQECTVLIPKNDWTYFTCSVAVKPWRCWTFFYFWNIKHLNFSFMLHGAGEHIKRNADQKSKMHADFHFGETSATSVQQLQTWKVYSLTSFLYSSLYSIYIFIIPYRRNSLCVHCFSPLVPDCTLKYGFSKKSFWYFFSHNIIIS